PGIEAHVSMFRTLAFLVLFAAAPAAADTVRVGAAISLKEALGEVAALYRADTGDAVEFSFGSSGQVMAQIRNGADLDVFVSAAAAQMDALEKAGIVDPATRRTVATNTLVLVVPASRNAPASFAALADRAGGRVATGEPKTVPAGQYARQVFAALKLTDALAPRLVYGTNVRQVLAYVERGEVAAGVVYATDAKTVGDKVRVVATAAAGTHEPIVYPGVVVKTTKRPAAAQRFLAYLSSSPQARTAWTARGFGPPGEETATRPAGK
ncbi:MAG: molybdenum transporter, periplasmic molybdate-binding protein, partial [Phycisphaerales bacterium]|nr:molybdenum transporter, periplasmic molybdate-binding protein [Phycisphaerales bacterium]